MVWTTGNGERHHLIWLLRPYSAEDPPFCSLWNISAPSYAFAIRLSFSRLFRPYDASGFWSLLASFMYTNGTYSALGSVSSLHLSVVEIGTARAASSSLPFSHSTRVVHHCRAPPLAPFPEDQKYDDKPRGFPHFCTPCRTSSLLTGHSRR